MVNFTSVSRVELILRFYFSEMQVGTVERHCQQL